MQNNPEEIKLLQLILGDIPMPHFGTFHYNKPNHGLEVCKYYMLPITAEIECLVNEVLYDMVLKKELLGHLDYPLPLNQYGPSKQGLMVLSSGDHGDAAFWYHIKVHLLLPATRKEMQDISYHCSTAQVAYIDCSKDHYAVLQHTIASELEKEF